MKKLNHENVIKLYEVIENPDNDKLYLVMEYATNVQLIDWDQDEQIFHVVNPEKHAPYPFS